MKSRSKDQWSDYGCATMNSRKWINLRPMKVFDTHASPIVSVVLLFCLNISLLWCSDNSCQVEQEDDCACLMCLPGNESGASSSNPPSHHTDSCSCVGQALFTLDFHSISTHCKNPEILAHGLSVPILNRQTQRLFKPPKPRALCPYSFNRLFDQRYSEKDEQCSECLFAYQLC